MNRIGRNGLGRALVLTAAVLWIAPALAASPLYVLEKDVRLPSTNTDWDYVTLDQSSGRLFMARRQDGLTVYDINRQAAIGTIENSKAANGVILVPEFNRAYVAMTDGTVLIFDLQSLKPIDRIKLDEGGLNSGVYDPTTKRVHIIPGARPQQGLTTWYTLDAATGKLLGKTTFQSGKMDDPASDGHGLLFATMRDKNQMLKLKADDLSIQDTWKLSCEMPVALEYDREVNRLFLGCRGEKPVLLVLDPSDGRTIASLPIGRGIDGLAVDEQRHLILTSNGADANLSVISMDGPDSYRSLGTVGTRPMARIMAKDQKTGRLFIVTADFTLPAPGPDGKAANPIFHDNSFTVLTYAPK